MDALEPVDFLMLLDGTKLCSSRLSITIINNLQAVILSVIHCYFFTLAVEDFNPTSLAYAVDEILSAILGISIIILMRRMKKNLVPNLKIILESLTAKHKQELKKTSWKLCIRSCISISLFLVIHGYMIFTVRDGFVIYRICLTYAYLQCWIFIGTVLYTFCLHAIELYEKDALQIVTQEVSKGIRIPKSSMLLVLKHLLEIKINITNSFSIIPCLWYLWFFHRSVHTIISFSRDYVVDSYGDIAEIILVIVFLLDMMIKAGSCMKSSSDSLDKLSRVIIVYEVDSRDYSVILQQIEVNKRFEYRAWNLFSINKSLLLSFTSSLLTFTVLFVQLSYTLNAESSNSIHNVNSTNYM